MSHKLTRSYNGRANRSGCGATIINTNYVRLRPLTPRRYLRDEELTASPAAIRKTVTLPRVKTAAEATREDIVAGAAAFIRWRNTRRTGS